jgi:long-chain acyl-CoA synthetase
MEDISALRPTLFVGVPRVFDRIRSTIEAKLSAKGGIKGFLVKKGMKSRMKELHKGKIPSGWAFVFDKCT